VIVATVGGALFLSYNLPGLKQPLKLTTDALVAIYSGKVTKWNDARIAAANVGVKLPNLAILPVHRSDGSGTTNIFTTYLASISQTWRDSIGANTSVSWPNGIRGKGDEGGAGARAQGGGHVHEQ